MNCDMYNSCNMDMRDLTDMYACSPRAYISGKSQAIMLQVICITCGTLNITQICSWVLCLFIVAVYNFDYGSF